MGLWKQRSIDASWGELTKMPVNELVTKIGETSSAKHLVFDGIITQRLIDAASKVGVETIVGHRAGEIQNKPESVQVYSFKILDWNRPLLIDHSQARHEARPRHRNARAA